MATKHLKKKSPLTPKRQEAKLKILKQAVEAGDIILVFLLAADLVQARSVKIIANESESKGMRYS
jgi:hypothetical protein